MAHEELKKQWNEDVKYHGKDAYKMWEYKCLKLPIGQGWIACAANGPQWTKNNQYRRKEPSFQPEYFSGLNWREVSGLVGKKVECSCDGEHWHGPFELRILSHMPDSKHFQANSEWWTYIRTCPETHAHATITIGGVKLPRPEVGAPKIDTEYWLWKPGSITQFSWGDRDGEFIWLAAGRVHLTEDRAQAWADWWQDTVVKAVQG